MINSITNYIDSNAGNVELVYTNLARYAVQCIGSSVEVLDAVDDHKHLFICVFGMLNDSGAHAVSGAVRRQITMSL